MWLLLSLFICAAFGQAFQCSFTLKQGGKNVKGSLIYDYDNGRIKRMIHDNTGFPIVTEFYQYDPETKKGMFLQTTNNFNSRCAKEPLSGEIKDIDIDRAECEIGNEKYTLSKCVETGAIPAPEAPAYAKPCASCHDQLDVVFVVDTSLSVCAAVTPLAQTVRNLAASYDFSEVRIGIVRFSWKSWITTPLSAGTSLKSKKIDWPDDWPVNCGTLPKCQRNDGKKNDCLGTCITCGVRQAVKHLQAQGRKGAGQAIIVLTDGFHNKKYAGDNELDGAFSGPQLCGMKKTDCHPTLEADLDAAKAFALQKFPKVQIYAYGQYVSKRAPQVNSLNRIITKAENLFVSTNGWAAISSQTSSLAQQVCGGVKKNCKNCNGYCSLGECLSLTGKKENFALQAAIDAGTPDDDTTTKVNNVNSNSGSDSPVTTTTTSPEGVTTTTTITTNTEDGVPAWGVALLALVAVLVVSVILLIALRLARPGTERV